MPWIPARGARLVVAPIPSNASADPEFARKFGSNLLRVSAAEWSPDRAIDFFLNLQVWGDPARCRDVIIDNCRRIGAEAFVGVFSYAGMPGEEAERSMRLFADAVLPQLKAQPILGKVAWAA